MSIVDILKLKITFGTLYFKMALLFSKCKISFHFQKHNSEGLFLVIKGIHLEIKILESWCKPTFNLTLAHCKNKKTCYKVYFIMPSTHFRFGISLTLVVISEASGTNFSTVSRTHQKSLLSRSRLFLAVTKCMFYVTRVQHFCQKMIEILFWG